MKDKTTLSDSLETLVGEGPNTRIARGQTITYEVNPAVFEVSTEAPDTLPVRTDEPPPIIESPSPKLESPSASTTANTPSDLADPLGGLDPTNPSVYASLDTGILTAPTNTATLDDDREDWQYADLEYHLSSTGEPMLKTTFADGRWIACFLEDEAMDCAPGRAWRGRVWLNAKGGVAEFTGPATTN